MLAAERRSVSTANIEGSLKVDLSEALIDVDIAFRQVEFTSKVLAYCELGKVDPSEFDIDHLVLVDSGSISFPTGHFSDADNIRRAAMVSVAVASGISALALDKAFEVAGLKPDPASPENSVRVRTVVYMVRCAYAHGIAEPRWKVRGQYARTIEFGLGSDRLELDLAKLNGCPFEFQSLGGPQNWFRIRDEALAILER